MCHPVIQRAHTALLVVSIMSSFTTTQKLAIEQSGNLVVMAGAGTGKTSTLVERCVTRLLDPHEPLGLDEILMVTFTEAAALEMKDRIRRRLDRELAGFADTTGGSEIMAIKAHITAQLALLDSAPISTLHSFCLQLIRRHFHDLEIDPSVQVLDEDQSRLLREEAMDSYLSDCYDGTEADMEDVLGWIESEGGGRDDLLRKLVFRLHEHAQTRPDPEAWFREQRTHFEQNDPRVWQKLLIEGFNEWRGLWLPTVRQQPPDNLPAHQIARILSELPAIPGRDELAAALSAIRECDGVWPAKRKTALRKPIEKMFDQAEFLRSLAAVTDQGDPLAEDWTWVRGPMRVLLIVAQRFGERYAAAKREQGALDFHDLEQFALRLLWKRDTQEPPAIARRWQRRIRHLFVDEYQDINAAQDAILRALGRDGPEANRFLVGDVKQSIYRFRLAEPAIFQGYAQRWGGGSDGSLVTLADNFRSREAILGFINPLFTALMRKSVGGVAYDADSMLRFGGVEKRSELSLAAQPGPRVEVNLIWKRKATSGDDSPSGEEEDSREINPAELGAAEREANWIAQKLREMVAGEHQVWDEGTDGFRAVRWSDMVVLLRAPGAKADKYAQVFDRHGVPLVVARAGFFDSTEVTDLLSLLQLLDNPLQDIPTLAVLRSPLVGLSLDELATIRLAVRGANFWTALQRWRSQSVPSDGAVPTSAFVRIDRFLQQFSKWRRMGRDASLSHRLELILDETHYLEWLQSQVRGRERCGNVRQLLRLAREFDPFQRHGLARFLRFVEAQQEAGFDREPAAPEAVEAVQLMSIHKSKGLEYPIVVLGDLNKRFNEQEFRENVVLDRNLGLCPRVKPPGTGARYPSLPYFLAQQRERRESLGEELRLLYVAMTRARDTLILVGTATERDTSEKWPMALEQSEFTDHAVLQARSYLDWLGPWLTRQSGRANWCETATGSNDLFRWRMVEPEEIDTGKTVVSLADSVAATAPLQEGDGAMLKARFAWEYPDQAATMESAKQSVSVLRRRLAAESEEESAVMFARRRIGSPRTKTPVDPLALTAAQRGTAHHLFLQQVDLRSVITEATLREEAARLMGAGVLTEIQAAALDFSALQMFWTSEVGATILSAKAEVRRELPFTARFGRGELRRQLAGQNDSEIANQGDDWVVVQGMVDLAVIRPEEIWLLDFKTDQVTAKSVGEKVKEYEPQLWLYSQGLQKIYQRPVRRIWLHFLEIGQTAEFRFTDGKWGST